MFYLSGAVCLILCRDVKFPLNLPRRALRYVLDRAVKFYSLKSLASGLSFARFRSGAKFCTKAVLRTVKFTATSVIAPGLKFMLDFNAVLRLFL